MSSISAFLVLACLSNVGEVASLAIPFVDVVFGLCDGFSKFQSAQQRFLSLSFLKAICIPCFWSSLFKFSVNPVAQKVRIECTQRIPSFVSLLVCMLKRLCLPLWEGNDWKLMSLV